MGQYDLADVEGALDKEGIQYTRSGGVIEAEYDGCEFHITAGDFGFSLRRVDAAGRRDELSGGDGVVYMMKNDLNY